MIAFLDKRLRILCRRGIEHADHRRADQKTGGRRRRLRGNGFCCRGAGSWSRSPGTFEPHDADVFLDLQTGQTELLHEHGVFSDFSFVHIVVLSFRSHGNAAVDAQDLTGDIV